jgi:hypothetical protein
MRMIKIDIFLSLWMGDFTRNQLASGNQPWRWETHRNGCHIWLQELGVAIIFPTQLWQHMENHPYYPPI